jgi:hypothetical protein
VNYVHLTRCVSVSKHVGLNTTILAGGAAILAILAGAILVPLAAVVILGAVIAYCLWWLYDRLICLGGEKCAIGLLGNVEPPEKKSGLDALDTDFSINLILAPHNIQELPPDYLSTPAPPGLTTEQHRQRFKEALHRRIADDGIQGELIKEQSTTADEKTIFGAKRFDFLGYFSTAGGSSVLHHHQPYLHCEFEGGGVHTLLQAAYAALAVATAAAIACAIPFLGWVVCTILSIVAAVISIAGLIAALNDKGKPTVVGSERNELHNMSDILFVRGDWVFDSAHEGWNELHPLKHCQIVARATYARPDVVDWDLAIAPFMVGSGKWAWQAGKLVKTTGDAKPEDWKAWVASYCEASKRASSPLTVDNQRRPEHLWEIHPEVDGCRPEPENGEPDPIH